MTMRTGTRVATFMACDACPQTSNQVRYVESSVTMQGSALGWVSFGEGAEQSRKHLCPICAEQALRAAAQAAFDGLLTREVAWDSAVNRATLKTLTGIDMMDRRGEVWPEVHLVPKRGAA